MGCILKSDIASEFQVDGKIAALYRDLDAHMKKNRASLAEEIRQFDSDAADNYLTYTGLPLAIGFYPVVLSGAQVRHISSVAEAMLRLMEKVTALFLREPSIREVFGFSPEQIELIEVDPGYALSIPCARFDSFFDGVDIRFTEINTDGAAGMDGAEKVANLFLAAPMMREFFSGRPVKVFDTSRRVLQTLLDCYAQYLESKGRGAEAESPMIAIVDWKEARTNAEFAAFEEFCRAEGFRALVADPRELEYDGRALTHNGSKIDLIYRRVVSIEYMERLDEVEAMTRAFKDGAVCVVGSFRSDVAFNKKVFALLHTPELRHFFTESEREMIDRHVPWTQPFRDAECDYRGERVGMPELARERKDGFVLKPSALYEGRGVHLGFQMTESGWDDTIATALEGDYVLQELLRTPSAPLSVSKEDFQLAPRFIHLGEFVFGGKFSGFYCRAAEGPLIDATSHERLMPCFVLES